MYSVDRHHIPIVSPGPWVNDPIFRIRYASFIVNAPFERNTPSQSLRHVPALHPLHLTFFVSCTNTRVQSTANSYSKIFPPHCRTLRTCYITNMVTLKYVCSVHKLVANSVYEDVACTYTHQIVPRKRVEGHLMFYRIGWRGSYSELPWSRCPRPMSNTDSITRHVSKCSPVCGGKAFDR
jgi:hypothetical protein